MTIKMNILSSFDDSGVKKAQASIKGLVKSQVGMGLSLAGLAQLGKVSVQAALADAAAQKQLSIALANATNASSSQRQQVEQNIAAMQQQFAVADDQLRPALAILARTTKDFAKSQELLKTALDISAATGRDLESVSLALGRAYQGNMRSLRMMGLNISDTAMKSKDFSLAMREVNDQVGGAAQAAAETAEGKFKKLSIRFQDLTENVGTNLLTVLIPVTDALQKLGNTAETSEKQSNGLATTMGNLAKKFILTYSGLQPLVWLISDHSKKTEQLTNSQAGLFRMFESGKLPWNTTKKNIEDTTNQSSKLKDKLDSLARTTRNELANALDSAKQKVQSIKDSMALFASSIGDAVRNYASLTNAVNEATGNENDYQDALKERAAAYAELNALEEERRKRGFAINDQVTYDADAYASAMKRVADAESQVNTTQSKQRNYSAVFAGQIAAAKSFAANLKALATAGLGSNGIQQLLDLGPVAGAQVAADLLGGVGGLTVAGLNADLANLQVAGTELGNLMAPGIYGTDLAAANADVGLLGQASVRRGTTNVTINVNGGDPQAVVAALRTYMKQNGSVPIKVSG